MSEWNFIHENFHTKQHVHTEPLSELSVTLTHCTDSHTESLSLWHWPIVQTVTLTHFMNCLWHWPTVKTVTLTHFMNCLLHWPTVQTVTLSQWACYTDPLHGQSYWVTEPVTLTHCTDSHTESVTLTHCTDSHTESVTLSHCTDSHTESVTLTPFTDSHTESLSLWHCPSVRTITLSHWACDRIVPLYGQSPRWPTFRIDTLTHFMDCSNGTRKLIPAPTVHNNRTSARWAPRRLSRVSSFHKVTVPVQVVDRRAIYTPEARETTALWKNECFVFERFPDRLMIFLGTSSSLMIFLGTSSSCAIRMAKQDESASK